MNLLTNKTDIIHIGLTQRREIQYLLLKVLEYEAYEMSIMFEQNL